jgi:hypothetical protein
MRPKHLVALALAAVLGATAGAAPAAGGDSPSIRLKVDFGGTQAEILAEAGELVRLRDRHTGEVVFLRAMPEPGKAAATVEISRDRGNGSAGPGELLELAVGERAKIRSLGSRMELQLLEAPSLALPEAGRTPRKDRFEISLVLPDGREVMAVGDARPEEVVHLRDRNSGLSLGFRPALNKAGQPVDVEVFFNGGSAVGKENYRFLARVPVGGQFTLRGDRAGIPNNGEAPVKIRGSVRLPDPAMWDGLASAGSSAEPIALEARWAGGSWISGIAHGGQIFRLSLPGVEGEIGLAPAAVCSIDGVRSISVFELHRVPDEGETLKLIDTVQVREDEPVRVPALGQLEIQIPSRNTSQVKGVCWVSCGGGVSGHGCGVSCGDTDCCVGHCCSF